MIKTIFLFLLTASYVLAIAQQITPLQEYDLIRNWGTLKYLDPYLSSGKVDMDSLFLNRFYTPPYGLDAPTSFSAPHANKTWYTTSGCKDGGPCFKNEWVYKAYHLDSAGYRALMIARFWNVIRYLAPDRVSDAARWDTVLMGALVRARAVKTLADFDTLLLRMANQTHDPHGVMFGGSIGWLGDHFFPPISLAWIDSAYYISACFDSTYRPYLGRRITAIAGQPADSIVAVYLQYIAGQQAGYARQHIADIYILPGDSSTTLSLRLDDQDSLYVKRTFSYDRYRAGDLDHHNTHHINQLYLDSILYIDLSQPVSSRWLRQQLKTTKAAILDLRRYPDWNNFNILHYFMDKKAAQCLSVNVDYKDMTREKTSPQPWAGKVKHLRRLFILISEYTVSRAEYFAAILKTYNSSLCMIGAQTVGAMGEMVRIPMYEDVSISFTAGEVTFAGQSYFKKGIMPDVIIHQKAEDIKNYKDILLAEALKRAKH